MKPTITETYARKEGTGRFRKLYAASLGRVQAQSFSRAKAIASCEALALRVLESSGADAEVIFIADREAIIVQPGPDGHWEYHFARDGWGKVASKSGWCISDESREDTLKRALRHADQIRA